MFNVKLTTPGDCDANERHQGREVLLVEDQMTGQELKLCQACFMAQLRLRSKGKKPKPEPSRLPLEHGSLPLTT